MIDEDAATHRYPILPAPPRPAYALGALTLLLIFAPWIMIAIVWWWT